MALYLPQNIRITYMTEGGEGCVDHEGLQTRRHMHLSADCSPHTRRIAGGGADSRISELSESKGFPKDKSDMRIPPHLPQPDSASLSASHNYVLL